DRHLFPVAPSICILYDSTSVFRPRSWSDVFYVSMAHNPYLSCLNAPINFPFSITVSFHLKTYLRSSSRASLPK
ncbi:unnamed protein product, partial [Hymenolepis diminuta]